MSDTLPEAVDARQPGLINFGSMKLFNMGDNLWIIAGRDKDIVDQACVNLKQRLPQKITVLGVATGYDVTYTPLESSLDLTRAIRLIVNEELKPIRKVINEWSAE